MTDAQLNALVAEHVFGWKWVCSAARDANSRWLQGNDHAGGYRVCGPSDMHLPASALQRSWLDGNGMMEVIEQLEKEDLFMVFTFDPEERRWEAEIIRMNDTMLVGYHEKLPHAVALAALRLKGIACE